MIPACTSDRSVRLRVQLTDAKPPAHDGDLVQGCPAKRLLNIMGKVNACAWLPSQMSTDTTSLYLQDFVFRCTMRDDAWVTHALAITLERQYSGIGLKCR